MPKKETTHTYSDPNATVGDAIDYVKGDPGGLVATLKWLAGLVVAFFRPAVKKP